MYEMTLVALLIFKPMPKAPPNIFEKMAIQLQLLDQRESGSIELILSRYQELRDAPRLEELTWLPERSLVNEMCAFNRAMRADIADRITLDMIHRDELKATLVELDSLYQIWNAVRDAKCDYYYVSVRRQAGLTLRHLIGDEAYYSGSLPPWVPIWRVPIWKSEP